MRLPWRRTRLPEHAIEDAMSARTAAGEHLAQTRERDPEVRRVARGLREIRERNGFSEGLRAMLAEQPRGRHAPHA